MKVKVKICGIRSLSAAKAAIKAGADYIGLNFVPSSKRRVDDKTAQIIAHYAKKRVALVGVFQNASVSQVNKFAKALKLDYVQLHGTENIAYVRQVSAPIIKRVSATTSMAKFKKNSVDFFLLDRKQQGRGSMVDLTEAEKISETSPIFFAGGLTSENVATVVKKVRPFAVDVASGIETNGTEDVIKIKQFIVNAKGVTI